MDDNVAVVEALSAAVHDGWMATKRAQGVASRPSEWGEEQMVPYAQLSERAKDLDRATVRAVLAAMPAVGLALQAVPPVTLGEPRACPACKRPPPGFEYVGAVASKS
jgi:hypothetical protein